MTAIIWPEGLPQRVLQGEFTEEPDDVTIRDEPDFGLFLSRPRATAYGVTFGMRLNLTMEQLDIFDEFYFTTLAHGSLSFKWRHPRKGTEGDFKFKEMPERGSLGGGIYLLTLKVYLKP